jgi:hypothetical protein
MEETREKTEKKSKQKENQLFDFLSLASPAFRGKVICFS